MKSYDDKSLIPFKRALRKSPESSETRLIMKWRVPSKSFILKAKDLEKFRVKVKQQEISYVIDSLKTCKLYEPKKPGTESQLQKGMCFLMGLLIGVYITLVFHFLSMKDSNIRMPLAITCIVILILTILMGSICHAYTNWKSSCLILLRRKNEIQAMLNGHNRNGIWYYRNLVWRCGDQGAFLILTFEDKKKNRESRRKRSKRSKRRPRGSKDNSEVNIPEIQFKPSIDISEVDYKGGRKRDRFDRRGKLDIDLKLDSTNKGKKKLKSIPGSFDMKRDEHESFFALHNPSLNISIEKFNSNEYYYDYDI